MARISRKIACKVPLQLHIQQEDASTALDAAAAGKKTSKVNIKSKWLPLNRKLLLLKLLLL